MSGIHFWLSEARFARTRPLLPDKVRGVLQGRDRRVLSGIIHVMRCGLMWRDAPTCYGRHKALYNNRFVRSERGAGVFDRLSAALAAESKAKRTVRSTAPT